MTDARQIKTLAQYLKALSHDVAVLEQSYLAKSHATDRLLDMRNEIVDWATNTNDSRAAAEIMDILEKYRQASPAAIPSRNVNPSHL